MHPFRFRLILAAALVIAAPAVAQDTTAPAADAPAAAPEAQAPEAQTDETPAATPEAPTDEAPAATPETQVDEAPATDGEAAPGTETGADAQSDAGDPAQPEIMEIVKDTFGDWEIRCAPDGNDCFMYQLARDQEDNPVAEVSILKLPIESEAAAGVTVVTPLGTLLPSGVVVQVDSGEKRQYPFAWCSQVGCFSRFGLDDPTLASMKRGAGGKITLVSVGNPEQPVTLDMSLTGFTAAYDALEVPSEAAAEAPAEAPAPQD